MKQGNKSVLVVGASSAIALALIGKLLESTKLYIVCVSQQDVDLTFDTCRVVQIKCDYNEQQIAQLSQQLSIQQFEFEQIYICNGVLHDDNFMPEKRLADVNSEQLLQYFHANAIVPILWLAQLESLYLSRRAQIVVFSARVGSISDNALGGWYGYRGSKSALNMMVKSAAIELKRKQKNWQFILFHPGTTNTKLSKPFQANVKKGALFTPEFVAEQLITIINLMFEEVQTSSEPVHYIDWQGKSIHW